MTLLVCSGANYIDTTVMKAVNMVVEVVVMAVSAIAKP